jgi:hypothetical protein
MIGQLKVLLRIKELKEERAFRVVNLKRQEVAEARSTIEVAQQRVRENSKMMPAREDAIYRPIIGRVVAYEAIEETKGKVQALEKEHTKLVDAVERATHVHARLAKELSEAARVHRQSMINRDKYMLLTDQVGTELNIQSAHREETEIEDIFSTRRRRSA